MKRFLIALVWLYFAALLIGPIAYLGFQAFGEGAAAFWNEMTCPEAVHGFKLTAQITAGDADYFAAAAASGSERDKLLRSARDHYTRAMHRAQLTILTYYTDDFVAQKAFPQNVTRANINELSGEQLGAVLNRTRQFFPPPQYDQYLEDRKEYDNYATRAGTRIRLIDGALGAS